MAVGRPDKVRGVSGLSVWDMAGQVAMAGSGRPAGFRPNHWFTGISCAGGWRIGKESGKGTGGCRTKKF